MPVIEPTSDAPTDVAPFAERLSWTDGSDDGLQWSDARDIERVVVRWQGAPPTADTVRLEYWQSEWPQRRIPKGAVSGAGRPGWGHEGDWFNGRWQQADVRLAVDCPRLVGAWHPIPPFLSATNVSCFGLMEQPLFLPDKASIRKE